MTSPYGEIVAAMNETLQGSYGEPQSLPKPTEGSFNRIVAKVFIGEGGEGEMVCHKNGDPDDNRASNLYWGTMSDNQLDSVKHGTHNMARKTHCIRGHEFTQENTHTAPGTVSPRTCRACVKIRDEARKARKAACA